MSRLEQRIAELRTDTARDRAVAARATRIEKGIARLNEQTRADQADVVVGRLPEGTPAAHRDAIRAAAVRDGLPAAKAVAEAVARSVGKQK